MAEIQLSDGYQRIVAENQGEEIFTGQTVPIAE